MVALYGGFAARVKIGIESKVVGVVAIMREDNLLSVRQEWSRRNERSLRAVRMPSNPYDNATCESFLRTLKREEICTSAYRDFEDLRLRVGEFIEQYYNGRRLHSALGYSSPAAFEAEQAKSEHIFAAAMMTFVGT